MEQNYIPTRQNTPVPEWYRNASPTPEHTPAPNGSSRRRPVLVVVIVIVMLLLAASISAYFVFSPQKTTCLDATDYYALTGVSVTSELSPIDTFYLDYVSFQVSSAIYDNSIEDGVHGEQLVQKVADFYFARPDKPMIITISGNYSSPELESLANERIAVVKATLVATTIPDGALVINKALFIEPEEDDSMSIGGDTYISVTSDASCR